MTHPETILRDEFARLDDDWESASRYLSIFIDECQQTLDELTEALLALEAGGGRENVEQLFIAAHRIKGSAASIGLNRPAKLAHLMEDILQILVQNDCTLAPSVADRMLACTDGLRQYVNATSAGRPEEDHFAELAQQLMDAQAECDALVRPSTTQMESSGAPSVSEERIEEDVEENVAISRPQATAGIDPDLHGQVAAALRDADRDAPILVGQVVFEPDLPLVGMKARLVYSKLSNLGEVRFADPPIDDVEMRERLDAIRFGVATDKPSEYVQRWLQVAGVERITVEPLAQPERSAAKSSPTRTAPTASGVKPAETLRVDVERLDRLMNLAGQLAIGKARAAQIGDSLKNLLDDADRETSALVQVRACVNDLFETIHLLDSVSNGIRKNVMDMRMLPIGPLLNRFHRVIRDITRVNGKDIRLVIEGEKTELDKRMIDELGDPMIHLVRNAADHGVESPEAREAAGKPRQGTIALEAFHRGSSIVIRVSDDGRGLDAERIRSTALAKGLLSAADAETMTSQQILHLIWLPGLSTAEQVTDVSGRGVGMDIVRSKVKELNGAIDVESAPGKGTTFTIRLPLTLAVLPSLMVRVDGDVFAVPLESVVEIVRVARNDLKTVHGHWAVPLRDRVVGVLTLGALFGWDARNGNRLAAGDSESEGTMLVILGEGDRQVGLAVDDVLGEEDVVIKSIADNYRNVAGVAGASILGDGRISLILDPPALMELASRPAIGADKPQEKFR